MKLLHIDSSILASHSVSRTLSSEIVSIYAVRHPAIEIVYRDLGASPIRHLSAAHMAAWQGGVVDDAELAADLAAGSACIDELFAADIIVIGAPMYNFSLPSQLKSWVDRIVIAGKTFRYGVNGPEGLLPAGKKVIIASSRGGTYMPGTPNAQFDYQETYLKGVLAFVGLADVTVIRAEGLALSSETKDASISKALAEVAMLAA